MDTNLPKELNDFAKLFFNEHGLNSNIEFSKVDESFRKVHKYLDKRYKDAFHKNISEQETMELLYKECVKSEDLHSYYQACFFAILKCENECIEYINSLSNRIEYKETDKIEFCRSLFHEIVIFLNTFEKYTDPNHQNYGFGRRNIAVSTELYYSTYYHIFNYFDRNTMASITTRPISVFLIRQAIETRFKNALGIYLVRSSLTHESININSQIFIDFIYKEKKYITVPIRKRYIEIIKRWTNNFIHTGLMPEIYKIWYAMKIIEVLFIGVNNDVDGYDRDGSIVINKEFYEKSMENDLKEYIIENTSQAKKLSINDFYFEKMRPEALIK